MLQAEQKAIAKLIRYESLPHAQESKDQALHFMAMQKASDDYVLLADVRIRALPHRRFRHLTVQSLSHRPSTLPGARLDSWRRRWQLS